MTKRPDRIIATPISSASEGNRLAAYVQIMRPHHWIKNTLVLAGVVLAYVTSSSVTPPSSAAVVLGLAAVCIIASSNYVINEILDVSGDRRHVAKRYRPVATGAIPPSIAYTLWIGLATLGFLVASYVNSAFWSASLALFFSGLVYNVPPLRLKDVPYVDVLSEGANSPIRLVLGWLIVSPETFPTASLMLLFWASGAFLMAWKRLREYRTFPDKNTAAAYRKSFQHYNERRLGICMLIYASSSCLLLGGFLIQTG